MAITPLGAIRPGEVVLGSGCHHGCTAIALAATCVSCLLPKEFVKQTASHHPNPELLLLIVESSPLAHYYCRPKRELRSSPLRKAAITNTDNCNTLSGTQQADLCISTTPCRRYTECPASERVGLTAQMTGHHPPRPSASLRVSEKQSAAWVWPQARTELTFLFGRSRKAISMVTSPRSDASSGHTMPLVETGSQPQLLSSGIADFDRRLATAVVFGILAPLHLFLVDAYHDVLACRKIYDIKADSA
jgi:hypothetical protein